MNGGLAAVPLDLAEYEQEHDELIAEKMPLPLDGDLRGLVESDKRDMLKYCKRAAKRRALPPWGAPVELTWMILDPTVNRPSTAEQRVGGE